MDIKLVDMKRDADEKEPEAVAATGSPDPYPWGLALNLDKDELEKLGVTKLPKIGAEYHIHAVARVTRVSQSASEYQGGTDESTSMGLQICYMGMVQEADHPGEENETAADEQREEKRGVRTVMD